MVQLLGSVVHQPDLLVLDEPFSGLDPVNQEGLERLIRAEQARGATVLFSTHVMAHAFAVADRIVVLRHGVVAGDVATADTTAEEVVRMITGDIGRFARTTTTSPEKPKGASV